MDKDKIVTALSNIQNGQSDGSEYHDELEAAIGVLMETSEEVIAAVIQEIHGEKPELKTE